MKALTTAGLTLLGLISIDEANSHDREARILAGFSYEVGRH